MSGERAAQLVPGQYPLGIANERGQEGKLRACQAHFPPAGIDECVAGQIETAALETENCRSVVAFGRRQNHELADTGQQFLFIQRQRKKRVGGGEGTAGREKLLGFIGQHDHSLDCNAQRFRQCHGGPVGADDQDCHVDVAIGNELQGSLFFRRSSTA